MRGFGDLEAVIMERLWAADAAMTVRQVHTDLYDERSLAYTTVMTVMDKLHRKGWLLREPVGRAYEYRPAISREQYTADLMGEALSASSDRSATLVAFLEQLGPAEASELRHAFDRLSGHQQSTSSRRRRR
ncbi:BlaI/MecI/CopY family transcriptional regulator [Sporichthya polymorpha]|uniref:BlaI/MecI/CopY family transcriptional regulator n=1 Tax=Sporichthya polymorpha TaxID=35751 RepID=UPI0003697530|nr:BlaI/MecI/CopY family transcriptional regulator [Sporichthya polymorpha]